MVRPKKTTRERTRIVHPSVLINLAREGRLSISSAGLTSSDEENTVKRIKKQHKKTPVSESEIPQIPASTQFHAVRKSQLEWNISNIEPENNEINDKPIESAPVRAGCEIKVLSNITVKKPDENKRKLLYKKSNNTPQVEDKVVPVEIEENREFDELIPPVITEENGDPEAEIDLLEIPKADLQLLLKGIQKLLPETESITPKASTKKLDWEKVAFGYYTAERCAEIWDAIKKRQRQYRYMSELIEDALVWLDTPWRSAKKKATKQHPDKQQPSKSAYILFVQQLISKMNQASKEDRDDYEKKLKVMLDTRIEKLFAS